MTSRPDLNLLRLFLVVFDERSVSAAADRVGLTQPAVSHALNRLRDALGDPLFERTSSGLRPTTCALALEPKIRIAMRDLLAAIERPSFDPGTSERCFTLAAGPYLCEWLIPEILAAGRAAAPRAQFFVRRHTERLSEHLLTGVVDAAMGSFDRVPERLAAELLFEEEMVWVARAGHPKAAGLGPHRPECWPRVVVTTSSAAAGLPQTESSGGLRRRTLASADEVDADPRCEGGEASPTAAVVYDSLTALAVVAGSDLIAKLPRRLVERHSDRMGLCRLDGTEPRTVLPISIVWPADRGADPALLWLRRLVRASVEGRGPPLGDANAPDSYRVAGTFIGPATVRSLASNEPQPWRQTHD